MMTKELPDDLVKISVGARKIGVSRRTIYNWLKADKIDLYRTAGGSPMVSLGNLVQKQARKREGADAAAART